MTVCLRAGTSLSCEGLLSGGSAAWRRAGRRGPVLSGQQFRPLRPRRRDGAGRALRPQVQNPETVGGQHPRRPEGLGFSGFRTLDVSGMSFLVRHEEQNPGTLGARGGSWGSPGLRFLGLWPLFSPDEGQSLLRPLPAITILGHKV